MAGSSRSRHKVRNIALFLLLSSVAAAQQPFLTDDADVTERGRFQLEVSNQYSRLQRSSFPNLRQNAAVFQLHYGLLSNLEIGVDGPLLAIFNARGSTPRTALGFGDTNFTIKWNFRPEKPRSPALTVSIAIEAPTGDAEAQLGSGVADYGFNTTVQKHLNSRTVLRINNGLLFSGNTLTGVVGLKAQGVVYSAGGSITRDVTEALLIGIEVNGAVAQDPSLGKAALQSQAGGKYALGKTMTVDFGLLAGQFAGSPRFSLQIGFSKTF
jgi:hypothetical protein